MIEGCARRSIHVPYLVSAAVRVRAGGEGGGNAGGPSREWSDLYLACQTLLAVIDGNFPFNETLVALTRL